MNVINKATARFILLVAILLFGVSSMSYAVPAYPGPVVTTQPDGSQLTVRIYGDEFFSYTTTNDGYIIARNAEGYFNYADYDTGKLRISSVRAGKGLSLGKAKSIPASVQRALREEGIRRLQGPQTSRSGSGVYSAQYAKEHVKKGIILLVDYQDKKMVVPSPRDAFDRLANQAGYSDNGGTGSIADFYFDNSMGTYRPEFDVFGPFTLPNNHAYYAVNTGQTKGKEHAIDAIRAADPFVDFSQYSSDGASVDLVLIYYAGLNPAEAAEGSGIWPHKSNLEQDGVIVDGRKVTTYACSSELKGAYGTNMTGIGTMSHEFGHALGLADVYAVGGNHTAVISWRELDLMNGANYNNNGRTPPLFPAYARAQMGWIELEDIDTSGDYTLAPLFTTNKAYRIKTDIEGEFYTLENRGTGTGNKWDGALGSTTKGLIVYHMDYSSNRFVAYNGQNISAEFAWLYNVPNSTSSHQCADLIEPSGKESVSQALTSFFYPGSLGVTALGSSATKDPRLFAWSGVNLGVDLTNIQFSGENITFTATRADIDYEKAQLEGYVRSVMNVAIVGAQINVYDAVAGISSPSLFSAITDDKGAYAINNLDVEKEYLFVATKAPLFLPGEVTRPLVKGPNTLTLKMALGAENPDKNLIKWYSTENVPNAYGASGDLYARIKFAPMDLVNFDKNQIHSVSVLTDNTATYATLSITSSAAVLVKDMRVNQTGGGKIIFDLTSLNIRKMNNEELTVTIKTNGKIYVDESALVRWKSNMMSTDGLNWKEMSSYPPAVNGSWIICVNLNEGGEQAITAPYPAIKLLDSYSVGSKFTPALNNATSDVESTTYSVNGTAITADYTFATAGAYTIVATVKYKAASGLGTETITRKITVK